MKNILHHVIFDLDGTIINSRGEILETYKKVFDKIKPYPSPSLDRLNYGATIHDVLKGVYGSDVTAIQKAKACFSEIYDHSDYEKTILYNGVEDTLAHLKDIRCQLYIATNKRFVPTEKILAKKNLANYFSDVMANEIQTNITLTKQEMILQLKARHFFSDGFMVGDSLSDIVAGHDQKLKTIAVTYGYENSNTFVTQNPTFIVDSFNEIIDVIKTY